MRALGLQLRTVAALAATRILLHRRGTTGTLRTLTRRPRSVGTDVDPRQALQAIQRAGRVLGGTCLAQAVALTAVLDGAERHPTLILGARREGSQSWSAHAWVVVDGDVLEPVRGGPHAELARLDATTRWVPTQPPTSG